MTPSARLQAVIDLSEAIATAQRPADGVAAGWLKARRYIGAKDRRAVSDHAFGLLRRRARLDWWLARAGAAITSRNRLLADLAVSDKQMPEALKKLFDGKVHHPEPLTNAERSLVAKLCGQPLVSPEMPAWVRGEFPAWLEPVLQEAFGDALDAEMAAMLGEAPLDLRVNTLKASRDEAQTAMAAEGMAAEPMRWSPLGLRLASRVALGAQKSFRDGLIEVQDEGSQLVSLLVDARPGQAVVDYCAGAGGKTLALAARMENKGRLVACDVHEHRVDRAKERLRRAGVHNVTRRVLEGEGDRWIKRNAGTFDRVLVDAPCTGTGTWRRNPDARWRLSPQDLDELVALQARIIDDAARLTKPGGRLVYVTCSLLPAENERQVEAFLARSHGFRLLPVVTVWREVIGGTCPADAPWLRLSPARSGTDGFFCAILERTAA